jgi:tetraprenyl-beta-curcumene synthase
LVATAGASDGTPMREARTLARRALGQVEATDCADAQTDRLTLGERLRVALATGLRWWEAGAAMGSQLAVLALIAAAADPTMGVERATAIECAYFPWIGALSTLLDSVVDQRIDRAENQRSLIDYYSSSEVTAERLRLMAGEARRAIGPLADASNHMMILASMAAFFHSRSQGSAPEVSQMTRAVLETVGGWGSAALPFFRMRRALARISRKALCTRAA